MTDIKKCLSEVLSIMHLIFRFRGLQILPV